MLDLGSRAVRGVDPDYENDVLSFVVSPPNTALLRVSIERRLGLYEADDYIGTFIVGAAFIYAEDAVWNTVRGAAFSGAAASQRRNLQLPTLDE
jgi:hypothetical protein